MRTSTPEQLARERDYEAEEREKELAKLREARSKAMNKFYQQRGARYRVCKLENYEIYCETQRKAVARIKAYIDDITGRISAGEGIVLLGLPGTGKDHLLSCVCHAAINAGHDVELITGTELQMDARDAIGSDRSEMAIISKLSTANILAISDPLPASGGALTDYQASILFAIVDRRYSQLRPTLISVNEATREGMEARMGVPTVDRLIDGALVVACGWPSYRKCREKIA